MTTQRQLELFGQECWNAPDITWQVLERDDRTRDTAATLKHIETYAGKLPASTLLLPVRVLYVPGSNFFLMPLLPEEDIEEIEDVEVVE